MRVRCLRHALRNRRPSRVGPRGRRWHRTDLVQRHELVRAKRINTLFALLRVIQQNLERTVEERSITRDRGISRVSKDGSDIDQTLPPQYGRGRRGQTSLL